MGISRAGNSFSYFIRRKLILRCILGYSIVHTPNLVGHLLSVFEDTLRHVVVITGDTSFRIYDKTLVCRLDLAYFNICSVKYNSQCI